MRRLAQTLMVGGVVYPAGTWEDDIDGHVQRNDVWRDGEADQRTELRLRVGEELREVVEYLVERHLAEPERSVSDLLSETSGVFGGSTQLEQGVEDGGSDPAGDPDQGPPADGVTDGDSDPDGDAGPARISGDYEAYTATALKAEIDARNGDTDPDAEGFIKPDGRSKDAYVAALTAHDAASGA